MSERQALGLFFFAVDVLFIAVGFALVQQPVLHWWFFMAQVAALALLPERKRAA